MSLGKLVKGENPFTPPGFKRLYARPHSYDRHGESGGSLFEQLRGMPETPRQRYIREQSQARYLRRPDAYGLATEPLFKGEIGRVEGFRFIESAQK